MVAPLLRLSSPHNSHTLCFVGSVQSIFSALIWISSLACAGHRNRGQLLPLSCLEVACHSITTPSAHSCLSLSKENRPQLSKLQQEKRERERENGFLLFKTSWKDLPKQCSKPLLISTGAGEKKEKRKQKKPLPLWAKVTLGMISF